MGTIHFAPIDETAAIEISNWYYEPPYDIYNIKDPAAAIPYALNPPNNFFAMRDDSGDLIGFCSFGEDGQVPGGNYDETALDIGMGIQPDLTGQGLGGDFAAAVIDFAQKEFEPNVFRVTIAAFNLRAQRVWKKNGFRKTQTFVHTDNKREFIVMVKRAK